MVTVWRALWHEPRPADAPPIGRLDWTLVVVFAAAVVVEGIARPDVSWRPLITVLALVLIPPLVWRRKRPLTAALIGWGVAGLLSVCQLVTHTTDVGLYSVLAVLILLYSVVRWGSGRDAVLGAAFVAAVAALGMWASSARWADVFGGSVLLLLCVALAAVFRYRADLEQRRQRDVRNQERVALARELHDTVAHHVSAIAVQAQAGGVIAGSHPEKAAAVFAAIESEASRTLGEMRSMVRLLRDAEPTSYSPQLGVADLPALARTDATPTVAVVLDGSLTRLTRPVDSAIYRIAQESLTNAVRHAPGAARVEIEVRREGDAVRLRVSDDGQTEPGSVPEHGFGLLGMTERVEILGGSLRAGPRPEGGWMVESVLPMQQGPA